ncbi:MAG: LamG domain-containing protein [Blautia sp.]|nr:LamG domain-containing protein [Blautia sp.]
MGKLGSIRKRNVIKAALVLCFFSALIGTVVLVEGMEYESEETAEVLAARRAKEAELEEVLPGVVPEVIPRPHEAEIHKEIVNDRILGDVPAADYSYSFDRQLEGTRVVTREEGGTYPEENSVKTPLFVEGIEGEAIYLDGSYGVELCNMAPLADSYTISFWMRVEEYSDWSPFLIIGSNLLDADVSQNYICFNKKTTEEGEDVLPIFNTINAYCGNSCEVRPSLEEKACIDLHEWNYITIRVDGEKVSEEDMSKVTAYLYINSEMIGSSEVSKMSFEETNMHAYLGINCFDRLFRSCYDEVRIWNTLLNENQITDMYMAYIQNRKK